MNHELCKQLKDAGFPQKGMNFNSRGEPMILGVNELAELCYVPLLSELVEACEVLDSRREKNTGWFSLARSPRESDVWLARTLVGAGSGQTKEEAVARLWLNLNQK